MEQNTRAVVIKIGNRFFYQWKNNRLYTAWHIAGAKLLMEQDPDRVIAVYESCCKRRPNESVTIHQVKISGT